MSIWPNATEKQIDSTSTLDLGFVFNTFGFKVGSVAVQDIDIGWVNINMREEVLVHECVVALGMFAWDSDVFVLYIIP